MKINTMTVRQALDAMGSEATDAEASALIDILKSSGHEDTHDIGDTEWRKFLDEAIAVANPQ